MKTQTKKIVMANNGYEEFIKKLKAALVKKEKTKKGVLIADQRCPGNFGILIQEVN